jgi:hypothetical protein
MLYFNIIFFSIFNFIIFKLLSSDRFSFLKLKNIVLFIFSIILISNIYNYFFISKELISKDTYIMLLSLSLSVFINYLFLNIILTFFQFMIEVLDFNLNVNSPSIKNKIPLILFFIISITQITILLFQD